MSLLLPLIQGVQRVPESVVDKALEINPYNTIAYGVLVVLLAYIAWREYQDKKVWQEKYIIKVEKTVTLLTSVESNMDVIEEVKDQVSSVKEDIHEIKVQLKNQ